MPGFKKSISATFALFILAVPTIQGEPPKLIEDSMPGWRAIPSNEQLPIVDSVTNLDIPPVLPIDVSTATTTAPVVAIPALHGRLKRPAYPPNCCPPATPPAKSTEPKKSEDPKLPFDPTAADRAPNLFAGTTEAGTQPGAMFNPSMFGDRFGGNSQTITTRTVQTLTATIQDQLGTAPFTTQNLDGALVIAQFSPAGPTTQPRGALLPTTLFGQTLPGSPTFFSSSPVIIIGTAPATFPVPLNENTTVTQTLQQSLAAGDSVMFRSGNAIDSGNFGTSNIEQTYDFIHTTVTVININGTPEVVLIKLPLPASGGVVGFTKLADNNSPMPRDRVIFDYDFSSNVPLTAGGFDVHRFSPGFEKTFFNGWTSFQLRVPFAATINSTSTLDGATTRAVELGDVNITLKALFVRRQTLNVSTGLSISFPTASDTALRYADGTDFVRIKNQSYILTPYVAALWTPNDRFFAQAWAQVSFDASGSGVFVNPDMTSLAKVGRIYDQKLLQLDAQIGYWMVRDESGRNFLSGLAPFLELHYNTPLNNAQIVQSGGFAIGSSTNRYDELNLSAGFNFLFNNRLNVLTGLVVPLGGPGNKFFDYQIGVRANWLFGASTRQLAVSNY